MHKTDPPAFVFGAGLTALGVLRSLGRAGIRAYSVCQRDELAAKSRWYLPPPDGGAAIPSPGELSKYLAGLSVTGGVLIPCSDDWTRAIAGLSQELRARFPASIARPEAIEIMTDKGRFAESVERAGISRPKTVVVRSMEELADLPACCFTNMFLKPVDSQEFSLRTGVKAFELKGREQALAIMAGIEREGYDGFPILLQEYIPGPATRYFLVDGFVDRNGNTRALIARRRLRMYPLGFGNSTLSETIPLDEVREAVEALERLWPHIGYRGIFDAEFKLDDRDGRLKIVEINPRPWWFVEFATRCGVDLCRMAYQDAQGLPVDEVRTYDTGRRCAYLPYDYASHHSLDPGVGGFFRWARSLFGAGDIIYCWDDPGPGIVLSLRIAGKLFTRGLPETRPKQKAAPSLKWSSGIPHPPVGHSLNGPAKSAGPSR